MAIYFQLTPIGYRDAATFQSIDAAICQNLDLPFDDNRYTCGWFDVVGFLLAAGKTHSQITDRLRKQQSDCSAEWRDGYYDLLRINHYLMENYTTNAWAGR